MATAKKLPSGSWRCLAFSHYAPVLDSSGTPVIDKKTGKPKQKRVYESFTSDDPSRRGKAEAERQAAEFQANKQMNKCKKQQKNGSMLLKEAMEQYISLTAPVLSGTTIQGYNKDQYDSYQFLMEKRLRDITETDLQLAIDIDTYRVSKRSKTNKSTISPKTVRNTFSFIMTVIQYFYPGDRYDVKLPVIPKKIKELIPAQTVLQIIQGTDVELPCLLACWLSFSMSEIRGIRIRDIDGDYITLNQVLVDIDGKPTIKESGKADPRLRKHRIPKYIKTLIDRESDGRNSHELLITMSGHTIYVHWSKLLKEHNLPHMTFHDLRHLNASVMALLRIPDKYAQERGGWSSDRVMKGVYTHTFSEEREKIDTTIDDYFEKLLGVKEQKEEIPAEEILHAIKEANPDGWYNALLKFMQHEMQHGNEEP